ncbi:MAG: hypothetical protein ACRDZ7_03945 [Acidimicrobiia bacterium]
MTRGHYSGSATALGSGAVKSFFWRWQRRLPSPLTTANLRAGYVYDLAFRQFEVSDTRVFRRPQAGRAFFEGLIRDHLDLGRSDQVALIFNRPVMSTTPGTFRTNVITKGVDPQVSIYYRSSRLKQYFKEGRALRTETVICDTRDFGVGRRVCAENWQALRAVGESANRRLCDAEAAAAQPAPDVATFLEVTRPTNNDGLYAPGLRFGEPRVMAVLAALAGFGHLVAGFNNHQLAERVAALLDAPYTCHRPPTTSDASAAKRPHHPAATHQPIRPHAPGPTRRRALHQDPRAGSHPRVSPSWTTAYPTGLPPAAPSGPPGGNSNEPSTTSSTPGSPPPRTRSNS